MFDYLSSVRGDIWTHIGDLCYPSDKHISAPAISDVFDALLWDLVHSQKMDDEELDNIKI